MCAPEDKGDHRGHPIDGADREAWEDFGYARLAEWSKIEARTCHEPDVGQAFLRAGKEEHEVMKDMKEGGRRFSALSHLIIGSAIEVHRELGPGLLEMTYRQCFTQELALKSVPFEVEAPIAIEYKGLRIECAYRIEVFVDRQIVVEIKSLETLRWIHEAQVLTYISSRAAEPASSSTSILAC